MNFAFPYRIDEQRRTATADDATHLRDLIEQVLFTAPGERVNRPTFGSGLLQLVFAPASDQLAATTQFLAQSALQDWLGDLLRVDAIDVKVEDATLRVTVKYMVLRTQEQRVDQFVRSGST